MIVTCKVSLSNSRKPRLHVYHVRQAHLAHEVGVLWLALGPYVGIERYLQCILPHVSLKELKHALLSHGGQGETWRLLMRAEASFSHGGRGEILVPPHTRGRVSTSQVPRRRPGASLHMRARFSLHALSTRVEVFQVAPSHLGPYVDGAARVVDVPVGARTARARAWPFACLTVYAK
jgi:hypothetical protein